jgi:hypothetical protein
MDELLLHVLQALQIVLPTIIPNKLLLHVLQALQIVLPTIIPNKLLLHGRMVLGVKLNFKMSALVCSLRKCHK